MSKNKPEADEFALGALALVFSVGFLKANELFDYFDRLDVFTVREHVLHIHLRELLALVGFALAYIVFLFVAGWGTYRVYHRRTTSSMGDEEEKADIGKSDQELLLSSAQLKERELPVSAPSDAGAGATRAFALVPHLEGAPTASPTVSDEKQRQPEKHANALDVLVVVMLALVAVHFFALCGAYSHIMHRYSEQLQSSPEVRWDVGS